MCHEFLQIPHVILKDYQVKIELQYVRFSLGFIFLGINMQTFNKLEL